MFRHRIILSSESSDSSANCLGREQKKMFSHLLLGYLLLLTEVKKYTRENCLRLLLDKESAITSLYKQETIFRLSIKTHSRRT